MTAASLAQAEDCNELSQYELERLARIKRNEAEIERLGIKPIVPKADKKVQKKKAGAARRPREPTRASTRVRRNPNHDNDADYAPTDDDSDAETENDEDDEKSSWRSLPKPRPQQAAVKPKVATETLSSGLITIERAKTGRAKCRKCMTALPEGEWRVGMEAWIMGRQAITWQRPQCFLSNLSVTTEMSGRGKCKATGDPLVKGEVKLGMTSHTNTAWVQLSAVPKLLAPVLAITDQELKPSELAGLDELSKAERAAVEAVLRDAYAARPTLNPANAIVAKKEEAPGEEQKLHGSPVRTESPPQPRLGEKTGAKGRVAWRFGGSVCFGSLLPAQETASHCFARTHKGNTKTLAKGKAYWWLAETA